MIWWWQFEWSEEWTPALIAEFGYDELLSKIWVEPLITCLDPHWKVKDSIFSPWQIVLSLEHQFFDLALKSPIISFTNWFRFAILSSNNSKFVKNVWNASYDWLGEQ